MPVADASALVLAVTDSTARGQTARRRLASPVVTPQLVDVEVGSALRSLVVRRLQTPADAWVALRRATSLVEQRFAHRPLLSRAWELRDNMTFYDAIYVALAERRRMTLLTADARLAAASGLRCDVELL